MKKSQKELFGEIFKETYAHSWIRGVVFTNPIQINCHRNVTADQVKTFINKFPEVKLRFVAQ